VVGCAEGISERFLIPVLEAMLHQFPFRILGFHSDNGSEYVNYTVARLLNKLLIEFTRSRPNRSQDNGLVEGKNGAVIRKHIGYGHIPGKYAERVQKFLHGALQPVSELPPAVRLRPRGGRGAGQAAKGVPEPGLHDALREAEVAAPGGEVPQAGHPLGVSGATSAADERHRVGTEDAPGQGGVVARGEAGVADGAAG